MYLNLPDYVPPLSSFPLTPSWGPVMLKLNLPILRLSSQWDLLKGLMVSVFISFYLREADTSRKAFLSLNVRLQL